MNKLQKKRLKELRNKDKSGDLSFEEVDEYIDLLNQSTEQNWRITEKCWIATFVLLGLTGLMLIVKIVLFFALR